MLVFNKQRHPISQECTHACQQVQGRLDIQFVGNGASTQPREIESDSNTAVWLNVIPRAANQCIKRPCRIGNVCLRYCRRAKHDHVIEVYIRERGVGGLIGVLIRQ